MPTDRIRLTGHARTRPATALVVALLLVLTCSGLTACSGDQQVQSKLIKTLDDVQADLQAARMVLTQHRHQQTPSTVAEVSLKYSRQDAASAQQKVATLSGGSAVSLQDQQRVARVVERAAEALRQAEAATRGQADPKRATRVVKRAITAVAQTREELAGR